MRGIYVVWALALAGCGVAGGASDGEGDDCLGGNCDNPTSCDEGGCDLICDGPECDLTCAGGGCQIECAGESCAATCDGGGCNVDCTAGSCDVGCVGDGCVVTCGAETQTCYLDACDSQCNLSCGGASDCENSCGVVSGCVTL